MKFEPNFQLYTFIVVVVVLLILLWFLLRDPWKQYASRITSGLISSNPELKKITWSPISPPDSNGIRTTSGIYVLTGDAGSIRITTAGQDEAAIKEFIDEVKFHFSPHFERIPPNPRSQLRTLLAQGGRQMAGKREGIPSSIFAQKMIVPAELELEQPGDLFVEFDLQLNQKPRADGQQIHAVAFIIDPRVNQNRSKTYSAQVKAVYDTVSVSEGSVNATLKKGGDEIDSGSVGTGGSDVMSSEDYDSKQNFKLKVKGTSGSNAFSLSGTWNVD